MKVDLTTKIGHLTFRNPVAVASGTFGTKDEYASFVDIRKLGAVITKTITVKPRAGNPMPRICETSGGMLNAIGLQNKGLEDFLEHKIPYFKKINTPLIVNIAGEDSGDFVTLARALHERQPVVKALELNFSCPNVEAGGAGHMRKTERILEIMRLVRETTDMTLFAKLSPELGDVVEIAKAVTAAGADGLSLINTLKGMAVDIAKRRPKLANITGGLSGPAIKPVALRYVYEVKKACPVPVIAMGGILTAADAIEFLMTGADLVAVGTANFVNPGATLEILEGIEAYCKANKISQISELRGSLNV
ncbi:MAG: dihydroorotate dehydrogenase [Candidatus Omnitrophota bacterium]|jgi:dihydroorotate dehydrogenase (NAD+) catalytic subunit